MSVYSYKARDLNGLLISGQMDSDNPDSVKESLADQGLIPIAVNEGGKKFGSDFSLASISNFFNRVKADELMLFTRQFHTLFKAGMDMETLLSTLATQTKNKFFADTILRIKTDVAAGSSLARAFAQHPKVFDELYSNMLATGEEAGILDEVLGQLSTLMDKDIAIKTSVKSAMLYPKIVVGALVIATWVLMTFVIPKFKSFFGHFGAELPLPTKIVMGASDLVTTYWYMAIGGVGTFLFLFKKWKNTSKGRLIFDQFKWKLPVFGALSQKIANARFANILGALYRAGLPLTRGLEITAGTMGHEGFSRDVLTVKAEVEKGRGIAEAMRDVGTFSSLIVEATAVGEKSGALDEMYKSVGGHYDMEVQHTLKNLTTMLEPILLVIVFSMIACFALAVFMPMWNMSSAVH